MPSSATATATTAATPADLETIVARHAANSAGWIECVRFTVERRWYQRIESTDAYDCWVITWLPGQATGFHDHGRSSGAFAVISGTLEEHRPAGERRTLVAGERRAFGERYVHDVRNASTAPAISIHVYSPPLTEMTHFDLDEAGLVAHASPRDRAGALTGTANEAVTSSGTVPVAEIDRVLAQARAGLRRLSPLEAFAAASTDHAVLVDIRPAAQRAVEGEIPGAVIIERNVLEWRLDPTSASKAPIARGHDVQFIVFCSEGYTSSLAAAALQELGLWRATDVEGGFVAWQAAGLPAVTARPSAA